MDFSTISVKTSPKSRPKKLIRVFVLVGCPKRNEINYNSNANKQALNTLWILLGQLEMSEFMRDVHESPQFIKPKKKKEKEAT